MIASIGQICQAMSMKLTSLSDIRRKELRRAAFKVLQREGLAGATLERVAIEAGASKGIVLHYFKSKQELFEQVMREANAALRDEVVLRLKHATTPTERLEAIVMGNFAPQFFQPLVCQAWLSLCAEVPRDDKLGKIQKVIHSRMHSNLRSALKGIVAYEKVDACALGISMFIDGIWLRCGVTPTDISRVEAIELTARFITGITGVYLNSHTWN